MLLTLQRSKVFEDFDEYETDKIGVNPDKADLIMPGRIFPSLPFFANGAKIFT